MHPVASLLAAKQSSLSTMRSMLDERLKSLAASESEYTSVLHSVEVDKKSVESIKAIVEEMSAGGIRHIEGMVTSGLRVIFTDDTYTFHIEVLERGTAKTAEFTIENSQGTRTPLESCGGGIIVMASFLLRVYLIIRLRLMRFVALDEAFIQVSAEYCEGLMSFLHTLVEDAGFRFLWVSHSQNYINGADHVYEMRHGELRKVEGYKAH